MLYKLNNTLGVPWNAQHNKNILPAVIGAVGTIGAGLIGALGGSSSASKSLQAQREANATNLQIARETNKANADLWREQSAYNTPEKQMQRFRDAGINPFMAMGQITGGNAETAPQMQAATVDPSYNSTAAAAQMQGYNRLADSLQNGVFAALDASAKEKQNRILESEAKYSESMAFQRLMEQMQRNNLLTKQNQRALIENFYLPKLSDMNLQSAEQNIRESSSRIDLMQAQKAVYKTTADYNISLTSKAYQDISNSVKKLASDIAVARSQIKLNKANANAANANAALAREQKKAVAEQVKMFKQQTFEIIARTGTIPQGKNAERYVNALISQAENLSWSYEQTGNHMYYQNEDWKDWNSNPFLRGLGLGVSNLSPFGALMK